MLIEIESPSKRMFRKDGQPTAAFTQAHNQLAQWKAWLAEPANQLIFRQQYCRVDYFAWRRFMPQYVLIFGRRDELEEKPELNKIRAQMQRENEYFMTFDRLHPIKDHDQYLTARYDGKNYRAISIPPTLELGPALADQYAMISGKEDAVSTSPYLSDERKRFLQRRFKYWDEWVRQGANGMRRLGDRE